LEAHGTAGLAILAWCSETQDQQGSKSNRFHRFSPNKSVGKVTFFRQVCWYSSSVTLMKMLDGSVSPNLLFFSGKIWNPMQKTAAPQKGHRG
jgi:hypothetical protein